ncbi:MAG: glucosyltransferase domain-containing protein [Oscillospiraceae bacterium]|nr:glucosyltransferase domain-containing protein [Oscillospiraceae bacterium]
MISIKTDRIRQGWQDGLLPAVEKQRFLLCLAAVFLWGLAAHAYGFLRASFSHDMLNALVVENVETYWKMQLGRPGIVLYRRLFRGLIAAPWLLGILSLLWLSLSTFLTAKLFRVRGKLFPVLVAGIMTVNLSTVAMTATYLYEMDANLFAVLLGVCAVFLWDRYGLIGSLAGIFLVAGCMGTYQSLFSVPVTLIMLLSIAALLRGDSAAAVVRKGLIGIGMLLLGAALYYVLIRAMCAIKDINLAMDSYNSVEQASSVSVTARILHVYQTWASAFWNPGASHVEKAVLLVNVLLPLFAFPCLLVRFFRKKGALPEKLLFAALLLLLPLGMNTAQLSFSRDIHDLMKYSFWLFYLLCLLPFFIPAAENSALPTPAWPRVVSVLLVLVFLVSNVQTANIVYTKKDLEQTATVSLLTRVMSRVEQTPDYLPGETPLVFAGISEDLQAQLPGFEAYYDITGCESSSLIPNANSSYNYNAYAAALRWLLNCPVRIADREIWTEMQTDARVLAMPCYPADGCIQRLDDVLVIRMGETIDPEGGLS